MTDSHMLDLPPTQDPIVTNKDDITFLGSERFHTKASFATTNLGDGGRSKSYKCQFSGQK